MPEKAKMRKRVEREAQPTPAPTAEKEKPKDQDPSGALKLSARQFCMAKGYRAHRAAGFLQWTKTKHGQAHRLTVKQWEPVWLEYRTRPVG